MTDFTNTIETTAASIEDLQQDLEAHLEDILGVGVTVTEAEIGADEEYGNRLATTIVLDGLEDELEERFGADDVWTRSFSLDITPAVPDGDPE